MRRKLRQLADILNHTLVNTPILYIYINLYIIYNIIIYILFIYNNLYIIYILFIYINLLYIYIYKLRNTSGGRGDDEFLISSRCGHYITPTRFITLIVRS